MSSVSGIFNPVPFDSFVDDHFNKRSLYVPGHHEKFSKIITWNDLNSLLDTSLLPDDNIQLIKDGQYKKCTCVQDLKDGFSSGHTLIVNKLHKKLKSVGKLAEDIGCLFGEPTQVNLYLSQPNCNGFRLHYDTHDVLVFQIYGNKHWKIYESTVDKPVFVMKEHEAEQPMEEPYSEVTLSPGDLLYVPRGDWHIPATFGEEPSLHLTLGIRSRTGLDFLEWLKGELSDSNLWRDSFTFRHEDFFKEITKDLFKKFESNNILEKYKEYCATNLWKNNDLHLPQAFSKIETYKITSGIVYISNPHLVIVKSDEDSVSLSFNTKRIVLNKKVEPLIEWLMNGNAIDLCRLDDYDLSLNKAQAMAVIRMLFNEGVIALDG